MINTKLNKTDYLLLAIYFVFFLLSETYDHTYHYNQVDYKFVRADGSTYNQINTSPSLKGYFIGIPVSLLTTISIVLLFFLWLIPRYLVYSRKYLSFVSLGILVLVVFGILRVTVWHYADNVPWEVYPSPLDLVLKALDNSAANAGFPLGVLLSKKYFESQLQLVQIQEKQKESELKLLQAQINPHFLFNNLNTLDALIDSNPVKAKKYITHLSALYRYLINTKDKEVVLLGEELVMIQNYFYLINTRFGDVYSFEISGKDMIDGQYLPVGALQVLIENVVKHNKIIDGRKIITTIEISSTQIVVTNNKGGPSENIESFGTGLENLRERYALLLEKEIIVTNQESVFQVTLPLIRLIS